MPQGFRTTAGRFKKARELMEFVLLLAARRRGMTLREVADRFPGDNHRSRQAGARRLLAEVEEMFPAALDRFTLPDGSRAVRLDAVALADLPAATTEEFVALSEAAALLRERGEEASAGALDRLGEALKVRLRSAGRRPLEVDIDALLESRHLLARPGPRPAMDAALVEPISRALLGRNRIAFDHERDGERVRREVEPWGLIIGGRCYLVARIVGTDWPDPARFRLDRISNLEVLASPFEIPEEFDLAAYARRGFGAFYSAEEYGEVVWKFAPRAARDAATFDFHPDQELEWAADGSLIVRFRAAGHLEMAWFLYQWGDSVEVIRPAALRDLVEGHRRSDFDVPP